MDAKIATPQLCLYRASFTSGMRIVSAPTITSDIQSHHGLPQFAAFWRSNVQVCLAAANLAGVSISRVKRRANKRLDLHHCQ
jgi:hypothetical protein